MMKKVNSYRSFIRVLLLALIGLVVHLATSQFFHDRKPITNNTKFQHSEESESWQEKMRKRVESFNAMSKENPGEARSNQKEVTPTADSDKLSSHPQLGLLSSKNKLNKPVDAVQRKSATTDDSKRLGGKAAGSNVKSEQFLEASLVRAKENNKVESKTSENKKTRIQPIRKSAAARYLENENRLAANLSAEHDAMEIISNQFLNDEPLKHHQQQQQHECPVRFPPPTQYLPKPLFNLRSNYFIYATLSNGPNNQLISFRETIFLAIRLNRTVVLPWFRKHETEGRTSIDPRHRVDITMLRKFVPLISLLDYKKKCNFSYDAVFRATIMTDRYYDKFKRWTGLDKPDNVHNVEYPKNVVVEQKNLYNASDVPVLFNTEAKCAVYPWSYQTVRIRNQTHPVGKEPTSLDASQLSDDELFSEIVRFTLFPSHLVELSRRIDRDLFGGNIFIAVHWRFDHGDWDFKCLNPDSSWQSEERRLGRMFLCDLFLNATDAEIAVSIDTLARDVIADVPEEEEGSSSSSRRNIYIASPPSEKAIVTRVGERLTKLGYTVFFGEHIQQYLKENFKAPLGGCDWLWNNSQDIISSLEMIICQYSYVFVRAPTSTWSTNVQLMRSAEIVPAEYLRHDTNIHGLLRRIARYEQRKEEARLKMLKREQEKKERLEEREEQRRKKT